MQFAASCSPKGFWGRSTTSLVFVFTSNRVLSWQFPLQRELSPADISRFTKQLQYKAPACHGDCAHETMDLCIINPRRACAARVTVVVLCVCLSVCLSVSDYSRTTGYQAAYERYQQLQCYKGKKTNVAISLKRLRSRDMA